MKNNVSYFVALCLYLICSVSLASEENYEIKELDADLTFDEKTLYKTAPRLLVPQAKESLPHIEKNVEFLCERVNGYLQGITYSMLCYTSDEFPDQITVIGEVRRDERLWNYEIKLPNRNLSNKVIIILESLSQFTYNKFKNENVSKADAAVVPTRRSF